MKLLLPLTLAFVAFFSRSTLGGSDVPSQDLSCDAAALSEIGRHRKPSMPSDTKSLGKAARRVDDLAGDAAGKLGESASPAVNEAVGAELMRLQGAGAKHYFEPHYGEEVFSGPFSTKEFENARIYRLGEGLAGGTVYRVVPRDSRMPSMVEKFYKTPALAQQDSEAMAHLSRMLGYEAGFKLAKHRLEAGGLRMTIEDVRGENLNEVISSNRLGEKEKRKVMAEYRKALTGLKRKFKSSKQWERVETVDGTFGDGLPWIKVSTRGPRAEFWIKPDNVIVDSSTLQLYIVDPY